MARRSIAKEKAFMKAASSALERLGARTVEGEFYPQIIAETIAGDLCVHVYERWIACRFKDVDRAKAILGSSSTSRLNPHSGKWNWHIDIEQVPDFEAAVRKLLPASPAQAVA